MTVTLPSYLITMIVLLAIIAVCMVIMTVHFLMNDNGKKVNDHYDTNTSLPLIQDGVSVADKLRVIKALRDNGTISEEQFQAMKQTILSLDNT